MQEKRTRLKMARSTIVFFKVTIGLTFVYGYLLDVPFADLSAFLIFCATSIASASAIYNYSETTRKSEDKND